MKTATQPIRVNPKENAWDALVMELAVPRGGRAPLFDSTIARVTGLTVGQVRYRKKVLNLTTSRKYREGRDGDSREAIARAMQRARRIETIIHDIRDMGRKAAQTGR